MGGGEGIAGQEVQLGLREGYRRIGGWNGVQYRQERMLFVNDRDTAPVRFVDVS